MSTDYTEENILIVRDIEHFRRRPGMFVGDTSADGLHCMLFELLAAAVAEVRIGRATRVEVLLRPDGSAEVADDGTETVPRNPDGTLFWDPVESAKCPNDGLELFAVRALSEWMRIEVHTAGRIARHEFRRGDPVGPPTDLGPTAERGFSIRFRPDPDIFRDAHFDIDRIRERARQTAFLHSGVPVAVTSPMGTEEFCYPDGIRSDVEFLARAHRRHHPEPLVVRGKSDGVGYEIGLLWCDAEGWQITSFANHLYTRDGGTHVVAVRTAIGRVADRYFRTHRAQVDFRGEDFREGLIAVVSVSLDHPQYDGVTRRNLHSEEVRRPVEAAVSGLLEGFFDANPAVVAAIERNAAERIAARAARRRARHRGRDDGA